MAKFMISGSYTAEGLAGTMREGLSARTPATSGLVYRAPTHDA